LNSKQPKPTVGKYSGASVVKEDKKSGNTLTTFPKKYQCDVPGCDKAYTKSSHVTRHKESAHREAKVPVGPKLTPTVKPTPAIKASKSKDKPPGTEFICGEADCDQAFVRKSDLTKHLTKCHRKSKVTGEK
jgi:uncharacterized C2H2 Zn-finger protein